MICTADYTASEKIDSGTVHKLNKFIAKFMMVNYRAIRVANRALPRLLAVMVITITKRGSGKDFPDREGPYGPLLCR